MMISIPVKPDDNIQQANYYKTTNEEVNSHIELLIGYVEFHRHIVIFKDIVDVRAENVN